MNSYKHSNLSKMYQIKAMNRLLICHHDCNGRIFPSQIACIRTKNTQVPYQKSVHIYWTILKLLFVEYYLSALLTSIKMLCLYKICCSLKSIESLTYIAVPVMNSIGVICDIVLRSTHKMAKTDTMQHGYRIDPKMQFSSRFTCF